MDFNRIAVIGNVDAGKSTLIGVMTKGVVDDGRGLARQKVMNFKHEKNTGQTSSIAHEILGFNKQGKQMLPEHLGDKGKFWKDVVEKSSNVVTLFDMCGHEAYLKTTIQGMTNMIPNYALVLVGANMGVAKMTREHLGLSVFMQVPLIIVVTKIDIAPPNIYKETMDNIKALIKHPAVQKQPVVKDFDRWAPVMPSNQIVPIFEVSSVSGQGVPELIRFISMLPNRDADNKNFKKVTDPFQMHVCEHFNVKGIGYIAGGLITSGIVKVGQVLLLGPDNTRLWKLVVVKSIQVNRVNVGEAIVGQFVCLAIKPVKQTDKLDKSDFKKGRCLLDPALKPEAGREFMANIHVLHHSTTMAMGYQCMLHCDSIAQAVVIQKLTTKDCLRSGDVELVKLRFLYHSEYLKLGSQIILREGRTKVMGFITEILPGQ